MEFQQPERNFILQIINTRVRAAHRGVSANPLMPSFEHIELPAFRSIEKPWLCFALIFCLLTAALATISYFFKINVAIFLDAVLGLSLFAYLCSWLSSAGRESTLNAFNDELTEAMLELRDVKSRLGSVISSSQKMMKSPTTQRIMGNSYTLFTLVQIEELLIHRYGKLKQAIAEPSVANAIKVFRILKKDYLVQDSAVMGIGKVYSIPTACLRDVIEELSNHLQQKLLEARRQSLSFIDEEQTEKGNKISKREEAA